MTASGVESLYQKQKRLGALARFAIQPLPNPAFWNRECLLDVAFLTAANCAAVRADFEALARRRSGTRRSRSHRRLDLSVARPAHGRPFLVGYPKNGSGDLRSTSSLWQSRPAAEGTPGLKQAADHGNCGLGRSPSCCVVVWHKLAVDGVVIIGEQQLPTQQKG